MIKQISGPMIRSGELRGHKIQPPEITHLTHQVPKPGVLARKLRDDKTRKMRSLAPGSVSLASLTAQGPVPGGLDGAETWAESWTKRT